LINESPATPAIKLLAGVVGVGKQCIASVIDSGQQLTVTNSLASLRKKNNSLGIDKGLGETDSWKEQVETPL
jgi:hypothetical protein